MDLKNWRAVYEYKNGLIRGAGACFAIAETEAEARASIESAMPGVTITMIREEQPDPRAQYERPHLVSVTVMQPPSAAPERKLPTCELCEALLVIGPEIQRRLCGDCERDLPDEEAPSVAVQS